MAEEDHDHSELNDHTQNPSEPFHESPEQSFAQDQTAGNGQQDEVDLLPQGPLNSHPSTTNDSNGTFNMALPEGHFLEGLMHTFLDDEFEASKQRGTRAVDGDPAPEDESDDSDNISETQVHPLPRDMDLTNALCS